MNISTTLLGAGLTTFPHIQAPYSCDIVPDSGGISKKCLTLSWAMLLHSYVPENVVSFTVDGNAVSVDFNTGVVESSPADCGGKGSAVYYSQMVCHVSFAKTSYLTYALD